MLCQDVMKRPVQYAHERDSVLDVARKMRNENIGFLPVCDESDHVIGAITDRDLALRVCAEDLRPKKTRVADVMTRESISCNATDELRRAQELMVRNHKSRIIIADRDGKPLGVVSLSDIAVHGTPFAAETLSEVASREAHH